MMSCHDCEGEGYIECDMEYMEDKYWATIQKLVKKHNPLEHGGCIIATRELIKHHPEIKEKVYKIKKLKHWVGEIDGYIIDTQLYQMGLIIPLSKQDAQKYLYTKEEYEKIIIGEQYE